ncbi:MAG TPA: tetratricopeptide repeat protein, partial [Stellaceae bacterium]|nr:tetratricopeptide repeat protein [Stellaceae bacterium]
MPAEAGTPTEKAKRAYAAAMERFRLRDGAGALDLLREAITHDPKFAEGYNAMAGVLKSAKRLPAAIAILQRGIEVAPTTATLYSNLGNLLWSDFRFAEAAAALHRAIEIDPAQAAAWHNLGLLCYSLGDSGRAIECYDRALERTKTQVAIRWDRSLALLARGEFERGFADYESRLEYRPQLKSSLPIPIWQGEPLSGRRLLLHYEQGLGDTLQFGRFIRGLLARGGEVHLVCQPELIRLFRPLPGLASVLDPASSMPAVDFQIGLASLPLRLGASLKTLPEAHYLSPAPGVDGPPIPKGPGTRLAVGLVWAGNPAQE